jgi:hypothetical protein
MIDVVSPKENAMNEIKEHMKVVGKDGGHVGTVDGVEGTRIKFRQPAGMAKARGYAEQENGEAGAVAINWHGTGGGSRALLRR